MDKKNYITKLIVNIKSNYFRMIIGALISFISSVVFARLLGADAYGAYTYMIWLTGMLAALAGFGLGGTITKFLPEFFWGDRHGAARGFLRKVFKFQTLSAGTICVALIISIPLWKGILDSMAVENADLLIALAVLNVLPSALLILYTNSSQALQKFEAVTRVNIEASLSGLIINIIVLLLFRKVEYMLITALAVSLYQTIRMRRYVKLYVSTDSNDSEMVCKSLEENKKRVLKYSGYMYVNVVWQQIVFTRSENFFLGIYSGNGEVAVYGIAYSLMTMFNMIFSPLMSVFNNYFSELVARKEIALLENIVVSATKYFTAVLFFILPFAFVFSDVFINLVYGTEYGGSVICFLIMIAGFCILQTISVAGSLPYLFERQRFMVILGIFSGIINIVLDIALIPKLGALGAAVANTSTQIISAAIGFVYIKKVTGFKFHFLRTVPLILLSCCSICIIIIANGFVVKILLGISFAVAYVLMTRFTKLITVDEFRKIAKMVA